MKFERTVRVRTPDGVDHDSVAAAEKHMFGLNFHTLGDASAADFELAVNEQKPTNEYQLKLRNALRHVATAAWPRASKGRAKTKPAPASERKEGETETPPPAPTSKRKR